MDNFLIIDFGEIEKFIIRQPPMGEKDDYDSENSSFRINSEKKGETRMIFFLIVVITERKKVNYGLIELNW